MIIFYFCVVMVVITLYGMVMTSFVKAGTRHLSKPNEVAIYLKALDTCSSLKVFSDITICCVVQHLLQKHTLSFREFPKMNRP
jgi:hypothetical protein